MADGALDGTLQPRYSLPILGKMVHRPTAFSKPLSQRIRDAAPAAIEVVPGLTMGTDCFYEGQVRGWDRVGRE